MSNPILTDRLLLRRPTLDDLPSHFRIHGDPATNLHNPSGPVATENESADILREWIDDWDRTGLGYWAVALRDDPSAVIGFGGIRQKLIEGETRLNLGFRFAPSAWGRGLATELGRAVLGSAEGRPDGGTVFAVVRPDNAPSIKVIQKIGMELVGEVDDVPRAPPSLLFATSEVGSGGGT